MKRWTKWMVVALLGATLGLTASGQWAMTVLDVEPGVRVLGSGGAGSALISGAETLYYNPAGLANLPGISFSSFYASYYGLANYSALSLTFRNWGIGAMLLDSGGIDGYDDGGTQTGTVAFRNSAFLFGAGIGPDDLPFLPTLPIDFTIGARIKYVTATIGDTQGSGFTFDFGFRSTLPDIGGLLSDLAIAVTAENLFGSLGFDASQDAFILDLSLGAAGTFVNVLDVAVDLSLNGGIHVGVGYSPVDTFTVRLGMLTRPGGVSFTAGVGIDVEGFLIDYAFVSHELGATHRVAISLDFSSLDFTALSRSLRRILP